MRPRDRALAGLLLVRTEARSASVAIGIDRVDPVLLEMFNNLFMHVAKQTGLVLQNTSQSVNIKARLDFLLPAGMTRQLFKSKRGKYPVA